MFVYAYVSARGLNKHPFSVSDRMTENTQSWRIESRIDDAGCKGKMERAWRTEGERGGGFWSWKCLRVTS